MLLIPECSQSKGSIKVQGYYGYVTIPASRLNQGGKKVHVRPRVIYQVEASDEIDPEYKIMISQPIQDLVKDCCNVFLYSSTDGRKLQDNQSLNWGHYYCLVWHKSRALTWWPSSQLFVHLSLDSKEEWDCAIIKLPAEAEYQVSKWSERFLHKEIEAPPVSLSIVAPIILQRLEDDSLLLPVASEAIVAITGESSSITPCEISLLLPNATTMSIKIHGHLPVLVSIGILIPGRTEVWLPDNPNVSISISTVEIDMIYCPQAVNFIFEDDQQHDHMIIPFHCIQAQSFLKDVKRGCISLIDVSMPKRLSVILRTRQQLSSEWEESTFNPVYSMSDHDDINVDKQRQFEEHVYKEILKILANNQGYFEIDFGNFGKISLNLCQTTNYEINLLDNHAINRIQWILSMLQVGNRLGKYSSGESIRQFQELFNNKVLNIKEKVLINRLIKYNIIPSMIDVYVRELNKSIKDKIKA
jgi:hypothetical protein